MAEKVKVAIIGYGNRGTLYANIIKANEYKLELVSVTDFLDHRIKKAKEDFNLEDKNLFLTSDALFAKGKIADILIIASSDKDHYKQAIAGLKLGYDILLEKPIASNEKECLEITMLAKKFKRKVAVCHVLRYTVFYQKIKEFIDNGTIGKVININQAENVGFWHYSHSYVRGNWNNSNTSSPMILAKCSHDLDILNWLLGKECLSVSSFGSLDYFKLENAPKTSTKQCFECPEKEVCPYNAYKFYLNNGFEWLRPIMNLEYNKENIAEFLKTSKYGKCVYKCDNNVVDHQIVNLNYADGVTASLSMMAFSNECYRELHVYGTHGDIIADFEKRFIKVNIFMRPEDSFTIDINDLTSDFSGHGGGDNKMFLDFIDYVRNKKKTLALTTIENSVTSHIIGFAAEKSRLSAGTSIDIKKYTKLTKKLLK